MKYTIEVTKEEYEAIAEMRSKQDDERQTKALNLLFLATSYLRWLHDNGAGDTYSTFCDDFGYEASEGENRSATHEDVMSTIRHAYELTE